MIYYEQVFSGSDYFGCEERAGAHVLHIASTPDGHLPWLTLAAQYLTLSSAAPVTKSPHMYMSRSGVSQGGSPIYTLTGQNR